VQVVRLSDGAFARVVGSHGRQSAYTNHTEPEKNKKFKNKKKLLTWDLQLTSSK
jgi:hypothetical protein